MGLQEAIADTRSIMPLPCQIGWFLAWLGGALVTVCWWWGVRPSYANLYQPWNVLCPHVQGYMIYSLVVCVVP